MAGVLVVAALELRHPIVFVILVEAGYAARYAFFHCLNCLEVRPFSCTGVRNPGICLR